MEERIVRKYPSKEKVSKNIYKNWELNIKKEKRGDTKKEKQDMLMMEKVREDRRR